MQSSFLMGSGYHLQMTLMDLWEYMIECNNAYDCAELIQEIHKEACKALIKAQNYQTKYYNSKHTVKQFMEEDKIWLSLENISM
ncbi:hypothetical protein FQN50_006989 [Emmonsiellopsis sp. PD_5]|nr:hypothetical protein FQN50_006989 [Emmonsiellopsis sp. PD_5]